MPLLRRSLTRAGLSTALAATAVLAVAGPAQSARFPEEVALPDGSRPEGIAAGPGTTFFAGSRLDGSIYRGDLRTGEGAVLVPGQEGGFAVGMQYDQSSGLLWVAGGGTGYVSAYDGRTGAEVYRERVAPPQERERFLNDLVVTREAVYVTDSRQAELVTVPLDRNGQPAGEPETLPLSGDFVLLTDRARQNNANGIRTLPGGDLVVVQGNIGELLRVDPETGVVTKIEQVGGQLTGGDGLERRGSTLYVVNGFENAVAVLDLRTGRDDLGNPVTQAVHRDVVTDDTLDRPTTGALTAGRLWVVNGRFSVPPTATTPYTISQLPLR